MIQFACPQCHQGFKVEDKAAGKKTKCPKCGVAVSVPTPASTLVPSKPAVSSSDTDDTFAFADEPPLPESPRHGQFQQPSRGPAVDLDSPTPRLHVKAQSQGPSLVYIGIGGVGLVAIAVVVTLLATRNPPKSQSEGVKSSAIKKGTSAETAQSPTPAPLPPTPKIKYIVKGEIFVTTKGGDVKKAAGVSVSFTPITAELRASVQKLLAQSDQIEAEHESRYKAIIQKYPLGGDNLSLQGAEYEKAEAREAEYDKARDREIGNYRRTAYWPRIEPINDAGKKLLAKDSCQAVTGGDGTFSVELPAGGFLLATEQVEMLNEKIVWCKAVIASENSGSVVVNQKLAVFGKDLNILDEHYVSMNQLLHAAARELGIADVQ